MKIKINKVSQKIKNLREQKKLTQEELAKTLGVSRQSIISLEQGRCLPSLPLALNLIEIFDMPFEQIFLNVGEEVKDYMSRDLLPFSPLGDIASLHESIDRLFEESASTNKPSFPAPQINVLENTNNIFISADLPGVKEEDVSIEVGDDLITISGERKSELDEEGKNYYFKEVSSGSFIRTIPLPHLINKDKAEAELKNGILRIKLLKAQNVKSKTIKIRVKGK